MSISMKITFMNYTVGLVSEIDLSEKIEQSGWARLDEVQKFDFSTVVWLKADTQPAVEALSQLFSSLMDGPVDIKEAYGGKEITSWRLSQGQKGRVTQSVDAKKYVAIPSYLVS